MLQPTQEDLNLIRRHKQKYGRRETIWFAEGLLRSKNKNRKIIEQFVGK